MAFLTSDALAGPPTPVHETVGVDESQRFAFGLSVEDVEQLRTILQEDCGEEVTLEEAWSRAAGLLSLTQLLLDHPDPGPPESNAARLEHRPT